MSGSGEDPDVKLVLDRAARLGRGKNQACADVKRAAEEEWGHAHAGLLFKLATAASSAALMAAITAQRQIDRLGLVIPINAAVEHANPQRTSLRHTLRRFWPPQFPHSPRVMPSAQQTTSPSRTMYAGRSGRAGLLRFPRPLHPLERPRPCRHCSRCRLSVIAGHLVCRSPWSARQMLGPCSSMVAVSGPHHQPAVAANGTLTVHAIHEHGALGNDLHATMSNPLYTHLLS